MAVHLNVIICLVYILNSFSPTKGVIFIGTGKNGSYQTSLVELSETKDAAICPKISRLPVQLNAPMGVMFKGDPLICGGSIFLPSSLCYKFIPSKNEWQKGQSLNEGRTGASGITLSSGSAFIGGGLGGTGRKLKTTELLEVSVNDLTQQKWSKGPTLPEAIVLHCVVEIDVERFLLVGGRITDESKPHNQTENNFVEEEKETATASTWIFNWKSANWQRAKNLSVPRFYHACGKVFSIESLDRIVVAGGRDMKTFFNSVEIYDIKSDNWNPGQHLPEPIARANPIEYKGDLLLVGGQSETKSINKIYRFNFKNGWTEVKTTQNLPVAPFGGFAFFLSNEYCLKIKSQGDTLFEAVEKLNFTDEVKLETETFDKTYLKIKFQIQI